MQIELVLGMIEHTPYLSAGSIWSKLPGNV